MARSDKSKYTTKQIRKAQHIEECYENRGLPEAEAERRAWALKREQPRGLSQLTSLVFAILSPEVQLSANEMRQNGGITQ